MRRRRCARCGRDPHPGQPYADCPVYVRPAPLWLRALTIAPGRKAPDWRAVLAPVGQRSADGYMLDSDINLTVKPGAPLMLLGAPGEPMRRVGVVTRVTVADGFVTAEGDMADGADAGFGWDLIGSGSVWPEMCLVIGDHSVDALALRVSAASLLAVVLGAAPVFPQAQIWLEGKS